MLKIFTSVGGYSRTALKNLHYTMFRILGYCFGLCFCAKESSDLGIVKFFFRKIFRKNRKMFILKTLQDSDFRYFSILWFFHITPLIIIIHYFQVFLLFLAWQLHWFVLHHIRRMHLNTMTTQDFILIYATSELYRWNIMTFFVCEKWLKQEIFCKRRHFAFYLSWSRHYMNRNMMIERTTLTDWIIL